MSVINATPLLAAAGGDYQISRSVRLRSSASAYFNRTPASAGNRKTWTWSGWVKRGTLGASFALFSTPNGSADTSWFDILLDANNKLNVSGFSTFWRVTTQVFRDPSAWYHVLVSVDTTQLTANNRIQVFVNGLQVSNFDTTNNMAQNADTGVNAAAVHYVGRSSASYFDGYLTEVNFIDGQALTPSSFGETDVLTGVWKPKKYTGTYGTNGFYLNFSDNSAATAAAIGKDNSGNGNNWTPNNISVTAGVTYDSMLDVPTLWADGGNGRGNYATFNPTIAASTGAGTITNGNLQCVTPTASASNNYGTIGMTSGKWYWEVTPTSISTNNSIVMIGIGNNTQSSTEFYSQSGGYAYRGNGERWNNGANASYGSALAVNDVIGVAFDADVRTLEFFRNGSSMGTAYSSIPAGEFFPAICDTGTTVTWTAIVNFGQRPFAYTPPTGFRALNTQNLPEPTIKKGNQFFDATTYTGNLTGQSVTNAGSFQPDLVLVKSRSAATDNKLTDAVRGATLALVSNSTAAETTDVTGLTAFNSNGFTVGASTTYNNMSATYVGWQWKESPSAGFDIVTYTGTGVARTISHSLGVAPKMIIVKARNSTGDWQVYTNTTGAGNFLLLNSTAASSASSTKWNNTAPTSSVFSVGVDTTTNMATTTYVAYLFSEVASFSRMGSYQGNGSSDGPFVFCGFRPKFILYKLATGAAADWCIADTSRDGINVTTNRLRPNWSDAEFTNSTHSIDFLSNGFKVRGTDNAVNLSGNTIIFAAFAENPFKNSLAR